MIDSGLVGPGVISEDGERWALVRSHEERRWLSERPIQSLTSPSIL